MEVGLGGTQKATAGGEGCPGDVWGDEAVLRGEKWVVLGRWFAGKDVEASAGGPITSPAAYMCPTEVWNSVFTGR